MESQPKDPASLDLSATILRIRCAPSAGDAKTITQLLNATDRRRNATSGLEDCTHCADTDCTSLFWSNPD